MATTDDTMRKTILHSIHTRLNARLGPFGGWHMPINYASGILAEHRAVRTSAGIFDVSHMGRLAVRGAGALPFLQRMVTNDVAALDIGEAQYSLLLHEDGGVMDDILVYHLREHYLLVVNASNADTDAAWLRQHLAGNVTLDDLSPATGMLAVQGPRTRGIVERLAEAPIRGIRYYHCADGVIAGIPCLVSRTGYTGEDGVELICPLDHTEHLWEAILREGSDEGILPAGLGARDTLRTEAGMPLYGHELTTERSPLEANLHRYVALEKGDFVGREAVINRGLQPQDSLVGILLDTRAPARAGTSILAGDQRIGEVTSGTLSPTLDRSIAMAYVTRTMATPGMPVQALIRHQSHPGSVTALPFYHRRRKAREKGKKEGDGILDTLKPERS